ncbi:hypothetical protein H5410_011018, partial [Solanum commersonii]
MALKSFVLIIAILAVVTSISHASDPSPLQDFCVAVNDSMTTGLNVPEYFKSTWIIVAAVNVNNLPGLNTLGISLLVLILHRAVSTHLILTLEGVLTVLEGTLYVGFVLSNRPKSVSHHHCKCIIWLDPPINDDVLAKAFQVDKKVVDYLQSQFGGITTKL